MASDMLWRFFSRDDLPSRAEAFRRVHEQWLTRAVRSRSPLPRIPTRRVDSGGFDHLTSRPRGQEVAERWWRMTFSRLDQAP